MKKDDTPDLAPADMSLWQGFINGWKKYVDFSGRARRKEYWGWNLFLAISGSVLVVIEVIFLNDTDVLRNLYKAVASLPALAVCVRRLHDTNRSGWNVFWAFTIIGVIPLFIWSLEDGTPEENRYGLNPKDGQWL